MEMAMTVTDVAMSLLPGVGWGKDIYEAVMGKALLSGHDLDAFERSCAILGSITGGIGSKIAKGLDVIRKIGITKNVLNSKVFHESLKKSDDIFTSVIDTPHA